MNPLIQVKQTIPLFLLVLACLALSPQAPAVCQQGCDPTNDNTFLGDDALLNNTTGVRNTAIGFQALFNNPSGSANTATGFTALFSNTTGDANTATGDRALVNNIRGSSNTATGVTALESNRTGDGNTANGAQALQTNTTGNDNTATGLLALASNTIGNLNTATGSNALSGNTTGFRNMANGADALSFNTTGSRNTADGFGALEFNSTGSNNTATGAFALNGNNVLTTGSNNTADGSGALFSDTTGANNTANGLNALRNNTTGGNNTALGYQAGINLTIGSNNIDVGAPGVGGEASTIRIGIQGTQTRTFVAGISGSPIAGTSVVVNATGRLGTVASSKRFKDNIKPMDKASEAILALKPVTFRYEKEIDPAGTSQFGLVAEDVEKVNPDLVVRDEEGRPYSVRYDAVNAMLLNEFLKQHQTVQQQGATIARLEKQIDALTAGLQKVSAQLEASNPAPQVVKNP